MSTSVPLENKDIKKPTGYRFSGQTQEVMRGGLKQVAAKIIPVHDDRPAKSAFNKAFGQAAAVENTVSISNVKINQTYLLWTAQDLKDNLKKFEGRDGFDTTCVAIQRALESVNKHSQNSSIGRQYRSPRAEW